jgi:hypothetical protein
VHVKCFSEIIYEAFGAPGLDHDVIDILFYGSSNKVTKAFDHAPLVCGPRVIQIEQHRRVVVRAKRGDEGRCLVSHTTSLQFGDSQSNHRGNLELCTPRWNRPPDQCMGRGKELWDMPYLGQCNQHTFSIPVFLLDQHKVGQPLRVVNSSIKLAMRSLSISSLMALRFSLSKRCNRCSTGFDLALICKESLVRM